MRTLALVLLALALAPSAATAAPRPTVKIISSAYGRILADGRGHALYLFTADRGGASHCYGACARAWPPFYSRGESLRAASGLSSSKIGTVRRRGGRRQVTYNGHPLYYFASDSAAGDTTGQGIDNGGLWWVVSPSGNAITTSATTGAGAGGGLGY